MKLKLKKFVEQYVNKQLAMMHLDYKFTIAEKASKIPRKIRNSVDAKGFFNQERNMFFICLKQENHESEPVEAKSKILKMLKTGFMNGDPENFIQETEVQEATSGSKDNPKENDQWFWLAKIQFEI